MATRRFKIVDGPDRMGLMVSQYQYWETVSFTLITPDGDDPVRTLTLSCQITGSARRPKGGPQRVLASDFEIEGFGVGSFHDITKKPWQPVGAPWPSDFNGFYSTKGRKGWMEFATRE